MTASPTGPSDVRRLPGAEAVLAAHADVLPQPDQLCGPFSAWVALHALRPDPPSVVDLAQAAGTRIWPEDVAAWRPAGAPSDRAGWDSLLTTDDPDASGTDAAGVAAAVASLCPGVTVVPAAGDDWSALGSVLGVLREPVGVLANVRTGPIAPPSTGPTDAWDVGHFVVLWGVRDGEVALADTYAELGAPGWPVGCRPVAEADLARALVGRGLLLLVADDHAGDVRRLVEAAGLTAEAWST